MSGISAPFASTRDDENDRTPGTVPEGVFPQVPLLVSVARFAESGNQAVAFVIDLTERKRVEAEARECQRRHWEIQLELEHADRVATLG